MAIQATESGLRVLHVIETLGVGGAEQLLVNILPELSLLGAHCEVAVLWPPYTLAEELEKRGITVHRFGLTQRWNVSKGVSVLKTLVSSNFPIIHSHLFFPMLYAAASRPLLPKLRSVLTFHNQTFIGFPANTPWKKIRRSWEAWFTNHCFEYLTAVSDSVGDHYAEQLGIERARIHTVPDGVPLDIAPDSTLDVTSIRRQYGVPVDAFLIVSPGRLIEQKGHKFLLEAVLQLRSQGTCPFVKIIGNGSLREAFLTIIREHVLAGHVGIIDALPHSDLFPLIQSADLVVLPSIFEGFGIVLCECMLLSKPVLATQCGGFGEIIEDDKSGVLVPPGDSSALASAIHKLTWDPDKRHRIASAARDRIVMKFSAQAVASEYLKIYRQVAKV